jgi:hypothetical protein
MSIDPKNEAATRVSRPDHVIFTDLDGVEGVLVDLNSKQYFRLNDTASFIWRGLENGTPAAEIAREMTEVYDVDLVDAQSSVEKTVQTLIGHRLLTQA